MGHTYTSIIADALARYKKMCDLDVCCLTGTDEHGLKIERAARQEGLTPQKLTNMYSATFQETWQKLGLTFDEFIRTTQKRHRKAVVEIFKRIQENDFIYLGEYKGKYCVNCEAYTPEGRETCPDCERTPESMTEESYFFRLSAFEDKLLKFYEFNPEFVVPATRMNEIISFVKTGLKDLSISRTSFRWGIPIPEDEKHIFYVWFDALIGYLAGIGFPGELERFEKYWPAKVQLIGKDILRFHAVYWPAFLFAAGLEPPNQLLVHGWWTVEGEKMSKSRGNTITTGELIDVARPDYIRHFLLREIPLGADGNFSYELLATRVNSDLANDLGNLCTRTLTMIQTNFDGKIPKHGDFQNTDQQLREYSAETVKLYQNHFDQLAIHKAVDNVWELIAVVNKYLVTNEPWAMAGDDSKRERLGTILYCSAESLRIISILLGPIIPDGTRAILKQLGISESLEDQRLKSLTWGGLKQGVVIGDVQAVFPRLDVKAFMEHVAEKKRERKQASSQKVNVVEVESNKKLIDIGDFEKVEMRVGKIISVEAIPKSERLLKIQVDVGSEVCQVVSGIGQEYSIDSLPGRLVIVVTNLRPAKLMGVESNGMLVAASDEGKPVLATFTEPTRLGARLK